MIRMLLVIPFYHGDRGQVERLGKWMGQLSGGKRIGEKLLFCAAPNADIVGIGDNFKGLFDEIGGIKQLVPSNVLPGQQPWPRACNFQFCHVAKYIQETQQDIDAFYYFEPDNLPLCPDWWDRVCADYEKQGKPFWGVEAPNIERDAQGKNPRIEGKHMIGTGIYPVNAWARIKGYARIMEEQPNRPWDALTRAEVNPECHFTDLISNVHSCRGAMNDGTAVYRLPLDPEVKRRKLPVLSKNAVIFHGCKDSSLRLLWAKKLKLPQEDVLTFAHAGDLGDIIYALPSIRYKGGGILKISPNGYAREPMTPARIATIQPLLEQQAYIKGVEPHDEDYVDFDFRPFRALHKQHSNLVDDQADWIGSPKGLGNLDPWLTSAADGRSSYVINRTSRYRNSKFPWDKLLKAISRRADFIGSNDEWAELCQTVNIPRLPTDDLAEVAALIKGSKIFIGNQSVCFAIAEGLKHPRIQETCPEAKDCIFDSLTGTYCLDGRLDLSVFDEDQKPAIPDKMELIASILDDAMFKASVQKQVKLELEKLLG